MPLNVTTRSMICAVVLSAAALLSAAPSSAAPASADPNDGAFIAALVKDGIVVPDQNAAILMAHSVCAALDQSNKSSVLAMKLMKATNLTMKQTSYFIGVAISAYCPRFIGHTDDSPRYIDPP